MSCSTANSSRALQRRERQSSKATSAQQTPSEISIHYNADAQVLASLPLPPLHPLPLPLARFAIMARNAEKANVSRKGGNKAGGELKKRKGRRRGKGQGRYASVYTPHPRAHVHFSVFLLDVHSVQCLHSLLQSDRRERERVSMVNAVSDWSGLRCAIASHLSLRLSLSNFLPPFLITTRALCCSVQPALRQRAEQSRTEQIRVP